MNLNIENKRVRELRGYMPLRDFALPLNVTPVTISKIETGENNLSADMAKKISKAYKVSIAWLFGEIDERNTSFFSNALIEKESENDYKAKYIEALITINALQHQLLNRK